MSDIKIDTSTKRQIVQRIIDSKEFVNNTVYQKFLFYLVEASIEEKCLKEATIAIEYFGRDAKFNPAEDPTVRVHFHNLRKKLKTYYLSEGKDDKIRLYAPKGRYEVAFEPKEEPKSTIRRNFRFKKIAYILALLALIFVTIYLWNENRSIQKKFSQYKDNSNKWIWSDILNEDKPILLVVGDYYSYEVYKNDVNRTLKIRDEKINSEAELNQFLEENPDLNQTITRKGISALLVRNIIAFWNAVPLLYPYYDKIKIRVASRLTWQDVQDHNIIFMGGFRTLGILNYFMQKSHLRFGLFPHEIYQLDDQGDTTKVLKSFYGEVPFKKYNKDFATVIKMPGPADNHVIIFAGFFFIGIDGALRFMMNPSISVDTNEKVAKTIDQKPRYFESIFEVEGFSSTRLEIKILEFQQLNEQ